MLRSTDDMRPSPGGAHTAYPLFPHCRTDFTDPLTRRFPSLRRLPQRDCFARYPEQAAGPRSDKGRDAGRGPKGKKGIFHRRSPFFPLICRRAGLFCRSNVSAARYPARAPDGPAVGKRRRPCKRRSLSGRPRPSEAEGTLHKHGPSPFAGDGPCSNLSSYR